MHWRALKVRSPFKFLRICDRFDIKKSNVRGKYKSIRAIHDSKLNQNTEFFDKSCWAWKLLSNFCVGFLSLTFGFLWQRFLIIDFPPFSCFHWIFFLDFFAVLFCCLHYTTTDHTTDTTDTNDQTMKGLSNVLIVCKYSRVFGIFRHNLMEFDCLKNRKRR